MHFPPEFLEFRLLLLGHLLFWPALLWSLLRAPWFHLRDNESFHVLLTAILLVSLLWHMRAGIEPGLDIHLLGIPMLTLMFGVHFGLLAGVLVTVLVTVNDIGSWQSLPVTALFLAVLPAWLSFLLCRLVYHRLPRHFFIYVFLNAFLVPALVVVLVSFATAAFFALSGLYSYVQLSSGFLPFSLLRAFPEAFLTGMLLTIFIVYRPQWVYTFVDHEYLKG